MSSMLPGSVGHLILSAGIFIEFPPAFNRYSDPFQTKVPDVPSGRDISAVRRPVLET